MKWGVLFRLVFVELILLVGCIDMIWCLYEKWIQLPKGVITVGSWIADPCIHLINLREGINWITSTPIRPWTLTGSLFSKLAASLKFKALMLEITCEKLSKLKDISRSLSIRIGRAVVFLGIISTFKTTCLRHFVWAPRKVLTLIYF